MAEHPTGKKPRFLPDPTKWIQTAPSSSTKKNATTTSTQRPLVGFRNGFATPPTRLAHNPLHAPICGSGSGVPTRQESLTGFFTPPPTISGPSRPTAGTRRDGSPSRIRPGGEGRKSRLRVRADSQNSAQEDVRPRTGTETVKRTGVKSTTTDRPKVTPLQTHRSAPVTSSSSALSTSDADPPRATPPNSKRRRKALTSSPSPPLFDDLPSLEAGPNHHPSSSDRPITPVPEYVLDIHRRLCGRDSERMSRVKSPWRLPGDGEDDVSPVRSKKVKVRKEREQEQKRHAIDERAHDQALVRRRQGQGKSEKDRNRNKENPDVGKRLVFGSSQAEGEVEPEVKGKGKRKLEMDMDQAIPVSPLAPLIVNTMRHQVSPSRKRARRSPSPEGMDEITPSAVYRELCDPPPPPPSPKALNTPTRVKTKSTSGNGLRRFPTGLSPSSAIPINSPSPVKKERASPVPVPESRRRDMPPVEVQMQANTDKTPGLSSPTKEGVREFVPVPMAAETLVTWSLGPGPVSDPVGPLSSDPPEEGDVYGVAKRPEPHPIQKTTGMPGGEDETQSLAPSAASQSFPNLVPSPSRRKSKVHVPSARTADREKGRTVMPETMRRTSTLFKLGGPSRSIARFPTDLGVGETIHPVNVQTNGLDTPRSKQPRSAWPSFPFGPGDTDVTPTGPRKMDITPSATASGSKRKSAVGAGSGSQSKLAAFGFFGDKRAKKIRGFDEAWDQEDDIPFEFDHDHEADNTSGRGEVTTRLGMGESHLQRVPVPPPHPDLRPAGLRELRKRERERDLMDVEDEQPLFPDNDNDNDNDNDLNPPLSSSSPATSTTDDQSSSFTTTTDGGVGSSAAAWWDGLEDRRSSEFGSLA